MYPLSADDLGATIMVKVEPLDEECSGVAQGLYGPIELTKTAKKRLEDVLATGSCKFSVTVRQTGSSRRLLSSEENNKGAGVESETLSSCSGGGGGGGLASEDGEEGSVVIESKEVRVSYFDVQEGAKVTKKTGLAVGNPRIKVNLQDMRRLRLLFPDTKRVIDGDIKAYQTVEIKALSPQMRDLIVLTLRAFMVHAHWSLS